MSCGSIASILVTKILSLRKELRPQVLCQKMTCILFSFALLFVSRGKHKDELKIKEKESLLWNLKGKLRESNEGAFPEKKTN